MCVKCVLDVTNSSSYKFLFLCEIMMLEKIISKISDCVEYAKLYRNIKF